VKTFFKFLPAALIGVAAFPLAALAQTDGSARLQTTLIDYNGSSTKHWTVVWVASASGTFIKTLWRQGPSITSSHWNSHCGVWYSAKAGSTDFDGYSSATAPNYTGTNSPVILTWNCRDGAGNLVPDGNYKFWVQYAEDSGQGPYTSSGLLWTKGGAGVTNNYPNQGANFSSMQVAWVPSTPPLVAPTISSIRMEGSRLILSGEGSPNGAYSLLSVSDLSLPTEQWPEIASGNFDGAGKISITNTLGESLLPGFYRLRSP